jgi:hypothetical protein
VIDEHIAASPVLLEANVLPMDIDKDPEWRSTAIFEREELIALVSNDRIPDDRRVQYALEGIAGLRHEEAAALRTRSYNPHRGRSALTPVAGSSRKLIAFGRLTIAHRLVRLLALEQRYRGFRILRVSPAIASRSSRGSSGFLFEKNHRA